jgi:hypothetical protein
MYMRKCTRKIVRNNIKRGIDTQWKLPDQTRPTIKDQTSQFIPTTKHICTACHGRLHILDYQCNKKGVYAYILIPCKFC